MAVAVVASHRRLQKEKERHEKSKQQEKFLSDVIHKYNGGEGDEMTPDQMRKYLQDLGQETYKEMRALSDMQPQLAELYGMPEKFPEVTDNEVILMMRMADKSGEGTIRKDEVAGLINAWTTYLWNKPVYAQELKKFDLDKDGKLSEAELKKYMEGLTTSGPVKDDDVAFVMMKADNLTVDGKLGVEEYIFATAAWEGLLQRRKEEQQKSSKSSACVVL
jgi:Ca2+-binding EF-hand superfamily protein